MCAFQQGGRWASSGGAADGEAGRAAGGDCGVGAESLHCSARVQPPRAGAADAQCEVDCGAKQTAVVGQRKGPSAKPQRVSATAAEPAEPSAPPAAIAEQYVRCDVCGKQYADRSQLVRRDGKARWACPEPEVDESQLRVVLSWVLCCDECGVRGVFARRSKGWSNFKNVSGTFLLASKK